MTAVAAVVGIYTNRASPRDNSAGSYTVGVPQNDAHRRSSNADARWQGTGYSFKVSYRSGGTLLWTNWLGSYYDWLTTPAPPPAGRLMILAGSGGGLVGRSARLAG